jgi:hypothetical protein
MSFVVTTSMGSSIEALSRLVSAEPVLAAASARTA